MIISSSPTTRFLRRGDRSPDRRDRADAGIPRPRTFARILGNNTARLSRRSHELYEHAAGDDRAQFGALGLHDEFHSPPAESSAPMLAHGCVCNYPMFASLPCITRKIGGPPPRAVVDSWVNQALAVQGISERVRRNQRASQRPAADVDCRPFRAHQREAERPKGCCGSARTTTRRVTPLSRRKGPWSGNVSAGGQRAPGEAAMGTRSSCWAEQRPAG